MTVAAPERTRTADYRMGFRPDIEGLRGVAVLVVLGFHASAPLFGGGYVGVDVFFVISGFLITGLLLDDVARRGRFSLVEFYARRARRILPAAGVVLLAVAVAGWLILPPLRQRQLAHEVLAVAAQVGNWLFVADQTDYLAGHDPSPLLHYWSLAVEEQFYLGWAPLTLGVVLAARRMRRSPFAAVGVVLTVVVTVSLALSLWWTHTSVPLAYLGSPSRAWQFGVGALAALAVPWLRRTVTSTLGVAVGWLGIAAIVAATVVFDSATPFPGVAALLPTLGAVAVIVGGAVDARRGAARLLDTRAIRAVGRLSFAWYLWHWPVLVLAESALGPLAWPVKLALTAGAALPAWLTLRLVERPLRFSIPVVARPSGGLSVGATAIVVPVVAALLLGSGAVRALDGEEEAAAPGPAAVDGPNLLANPRGGTGGPVWPAPARAKVDYPRIADCQVEPAATVSPPCLFGDAGAERIVLIGDSHAAQWFPTVRELAARRHWAVEVLTKSGCPVPELAVTSPQLGRAYRECDTWRNHVVERVTTGKKPKLVVVASLNRYTGDVPTLRAAWDKTLTRLGTPVVYLKDTPFPAKDIPTCLSGSLRDWSACDFPRDQALWPDPLADDITAGRRTGMSVVDVNTVLCPAARCPAVLDGVLLYRDDAHLTDSAAGLLAGRVDHALTNLGVVPPAGWTLAWRDDFDGPAGAPPSAENWLHDVGTCYPGCPAPRWGTGEIETMTDSTRNAALDGHGRLAITPVLADGQWTSARIESRRADFQPPDHGVLRVEASLRLPQVSGVDGGGYWPAFWTLGAPLRNGYTGWPGVGELDVMESVNGQPTVYAAMHCGSLPDGPCREASGGLGSAARPCPGCSDGFHNYAVEVDFSTTPQEARFFVDGVPHHKVSAADMDPASWQRATAHGLFVILNVAIGGQFPESRGGVPNPATASGRPMLVDHVAVYTRK